MNVYMYVILRYEMSVKLLTVGDSGVGKSCIIQRYAEGKFDHSYISTIGIKTLKNHLNFLTFSISPHPKLLTHSN